MQAYVPWFQETRVLLILRAANGTVLCSNRFIDEAVEVNEGPARNRHDDFGELRSERSWLSSVQMLRKEMLAREAGLIYLDATDDPDY